MIIYLRIYSMRSSLFNRKVFEILLEDRGDLTVKGKGQDHLRITMNGCAERSKLKMSQKVIFTIFANVFGRNIKHHECK